ncbi:MAG: T9SS type A sorting domain-containing protein [Saprospiraceae bacterium]|nr:T9SS type A sorting domain-containing protein [Saprospiraceae bacterium]
MKKHLCFFSFALLLAQQVGGQKFDYQWPFGDGHSISTGFGVSLLDFNNGHVTVSPFAETDPEMSNAGSFICDENGELMLLTNNCQVFDRNFQVISGGDSLTPGTTFNNFCTEFGDYPANQSSLFLPAMDNDSVIYLLHKDSELSDVLQDVVSQHFYLSVIVRKQNGSFLLKEKILLLNTNMVVNRLTACLHQDGVRWWTWVAGYDTNKFYKFLIGGSAHVQGPFIQQIGIPLINQELDIGQAAFSPDATYLGINNEAHGAMVYRFNPETGELSTPQIFSYPNMNTAEGLVFSPDSRFIYLTAGRDLYQMDLQETDPSASTIHLANVSLPDETGWPIGVGYMYLGPDCRIYIGPGTTTFYIHTIHQPNEKGVNCNFEINAIKAPTRLEFNLPNLPMYRFNGQCDSGIGWGNVGAVEPEKPGQSVQIVPNPVSNQATILLPKDQSVSALLVLDMFGRMVKRIDVFDMQTEIVLFTDGLPPGIYFLNSLGAPNIAMVKFVKSSN